MQVCWIASTVAGPAELWKGEMQLHIIYVDTDNGETMISHNALWFNKANSCVHGYFQCYTGVPQAKKISPACAN